METGALVSRSYRGGANADVCSSTCRNDGAYRRRIRHQGDNRTEDHHQHTNPDPGNQRVQMGFDDRSPGLWILALINDIQVLLQRRAYRWDVLLLLVGGVKAAFRIKRVNLPATLEDLHDRHVCAV